MSHVATMAKDTGLLPEEIWSPHGIPAVLTPEDVQENPDGTITPISEQAKKMFANGQLDTLHMSRPESIALKTVSNKKSGTRVPHFRANFGPVLTETGG